MKQKSRKNAQKTRSFYQKTSVFFLIFFDEFLMVFKRFSLVFLSAQRNQQHQNSVNDWLMEQINP